MQVVHLVGAPKKQRWGNGADREGRKLVQGVLMRRLPWGHLGLSPAGTSGRWCGTRHTGGPPRVKRTVLILYFHSLLAEGCPQCHSVQSAPGIRQQKALSQGGAGAAWRSGWGTAASATMARARSPTVHAPGGGGGRQFSLQTQPSRHVTKHQDMLLPLPWRIIVPLCQRMEECVHR